MRGVVATRRRAADMTGESNVEERSGRVDMAREGSGCRQLSEGNMESD